MIVAIDTTIHEISDSGAFFKWPSCHCEKCSQKMWGHGYVDRYFEGISGPVRIKRLICPGCGIVLIFRPKAFFSRFQSSIENIFNILCTRLQTGFWPRGFIRQRGWYWLKRLMTAVLINHSPHPLDFLKGRFAKEVHFFV